MMKDGLTIDLRFSGLCETQIFLICLRAMYRVLEVVCDDDGRVLWLGVT